MDDKSQPRDIKERTFEFAGEIVRVAQDLDTKPGTTRTLGRQLLRSGTSIGANMEDAQAGQSRPDFISKYSIALKEARETIYWLRLLKSSGVSVDERLEGLRQEAEQIARIIGSIIVNTRKGS